MSRTAVPGRQTNEPMTTTTTQTTTRKAMRLDDILVPTAVFVMAIILWELIVLLWKPPVFLLPAPHQIWAVVRRQCRQSLLLWPQHLPRSARRFYRRLRA